MQVTNEDQADGGPLQSRALIYTYSTDCQIDRAYHVLMCFLPIIRTYLDKLLALWIVICSAVPTVLIVVLKKILPFCKDKTLYLTLSTLFVFLLV